SVWARYSRLSHVSPGEFGARTVGPGQTPRVVRNPRSASRPYTWRPAAHVCASGSSKIVKANVLPSGQRTGSPAEAALVGLEQQSVDRQSHEINHDLIFAAARQRLGELGRPVADNDDVGSVDDVVDRRAQQRREVRNLLLDVLLVGADEPRQRHVPIVDA